MTIAAGVLWFLVGLVVAATVLPLAKIPHGAIRSLEFPRLQIIVMQIVLMAAAVAVLSGTARVVCLALLAAALVMQALNVARFTILWRHQSVRAEEDLVADEGAAIKILASNVKLSNRRFDALIDLVRAERPDILIALETDEQWVEALREVAGDFVTHVERPQDNGYGMVVYSRLPMEEIDVRCVVVDLVPSVKAIVRTRSGLAFRLYAIHPEPPVPYLDSEGRDAEIGLIGLEAKDDPMPALVVGDINDVAWSATTRRFQRLSGLLDPRVGRGFYNTFDARYGFLRWPLDHLFHDPAFRIVEMRRGPDIGSDHFPMLFSLALTTEEDANESPEEGDPEETAEMREMIAEEQKSDRKAIGSDWEDG